MKGYENRCSNTGTLYCFLLERRSSCTFYRHSHPGTRITNYMYENNKSPVSLLDTHCLWWSLRQSPQEGSRRSGDQGRGQKARQFRKYALHILEGKYMISQTISVEVTRLWLYMAEHEMLVILSQITSRLSCPTEFPHDWLCIPGHWTVFYRDLGRFSSRLTSQSYHCNWSCYIVHVWKYYLVRLKLSLELHITRQNVRIAMLGILSRTDISD